MDNDNILCVCGRVWTVKRFALTQRCRDSAVCLCGQTLLCWDEAVDYVLEPVGRSIACADQAQHMLGKTWHAAGTCLCSAPYPRTLTPV